MAENRMSLSNVSKGKKERPVLSIIYGVAGVGKSTFASQAPSPIFLSSEDGVDHLDVARFPSPKSWNDVLDAIKTLTVEDHSYKTLVIDSLDWLEPICWQAVCAEARCRSIEDMPYGRGYVAALEKWRQLLGKITTMVKTKSMNVVLIGHAMVSKIDDPQAGAFDRYRLKLHTKSSDVVMEWADVALFARHEVSTVERKGKVRGVSSGARVMYTTWTAAYDAKNRYDLPDVLPLDWQELERNIRAAMPVDGLLAEVKSLVELIPDADRERARKAFEWAGQDRNKLRQLANKLRVALDSSESSNHGGDKPESEAAE